MTVAASLPIARRVGVLLALAALALISPSPVRAATALPDDARVVFLHHSTGGVIWGGGVPEWIAAYDDAHGTAYAIDQLAYPDSPYPWDNYPYDYWNLWVAHAGTTWQSQPSLETLTATYDVVVFKHCFPVSGIGPDSGTPDASSPEKTLENYQAQYAALKTRLHAFPQHRFIVWTGAALRAEDTSPEQAARAHAFADWVRTEWDERGDNIFVWDFFTLETDGGNVLTPAHASGDSHPNDTFAAEVAPLFAQRVVDVIRGVADSLDTVSVPTGVPGATLALAGANPCAGPVRLRAALAAAGPLTLVVLDAAGRRVATLADGTAAAGTREWAWDAAASHARPGVYFARLTTVRGASTLRFVRLE
jgi:hypothetical protein